MKRLWRVIAHALTHDIDPKPGCDRCVCLAARILISELEAEADLIEAADREDTL